MKSVNPQGHPALAIQLGATTPVPAEGAGAVVFSTVTSSLMTWDGAIWQAYSGVQYCCLTSAYTLTSQTAAQKLFNSSSLGQITLPVGLYEFECVFSLSGMSATSGSFGFALGGTATFTQAWLAEASKNALTTASNLQATFNTAANTTLYSATAIATGFARIRGVIRVTVAGTIVPQVSLTVAAAAIVGANSWFKIAPLGSSGSANVGNWS